MTHARNRSWRCIGLSVSLMLLGGCAATTPPAPAHQPADDGLRPVWPGGGQPTRIVHRQNILGLRAGKPGLFDMIAGPRRQPLLRPQSIAVGDGHYFIVDQELQGVHVLREDLGRARFIERVDPRTYFVSPVGVAWCDGAIAVSDSGLNQVFILSSEGRLIRRLDRPGGFARPTGLAFDAQRRWLYVVDTLAHQVCVFDAAGQFLRTIGGPGSLAGEFHYPTYAAIDQAGRLYVTDSLNFRVQAFSLDGQYQFDIGQLGNASGYLAVPKGVGVDRFGHIYIVDSYFSAVQVFNNRGQLLLSFGAVGQASGEFSVPTGLLVTPDNRIHVCDSQNGRVQVFEYVGGAEP